MKLPKWERNNRKVNMAKGLLLFGIFCLSFMGCSRFIPDPTAHNQTPLYPGKQWDPSYSEFYCEERLSKKQENYLPEITEDSDIAELLDVALRNHPLTKQAWAEARSSAFALGAAQSVWYPEITGTEGWEYRNSTGGSGGNGTANNQSNTATNTTNGNGGGFVTGKTQSVFWELTISYLLLDFGGRRASVESARQALYAVNWTQNRTVQEVIINVLQGYYNYVSSKELLIATESDLKNSLSGLDAATTLYDSGVGKYLDVLQSKSNVADKELSLIQAKGQVEIYLAQLATALGIPPSSKIDTRKLPDRFPMHEISTDVEELMDKAKRNRPDLAAAWAEMLQKKQDIRYQVSSSLPTLTTDINLDKRKYIWNSNIVTHNYSSVIQINFPIFQGFYYINQIRQAKEDYKAAKANYENLESQALLDVVTSYTNFISAKEALASSENYLKFSNEARETAYGSYKAGVSTFLDLLAADAALAQAKSKNITARANFGVALFNVAYTTGLLNVPFVAKSVHEREEKNE